VTGTLVFEGGGRIGEYIGGYTDWLRHQERIAGRKAEPVQPKSPDSKSRPVPQRRSGKSEKLSFKEQKELTDLPVKIESLEAEQSRLHSAINDPAFYRKPPAEVAASLARMDEIVRELEVCYSRWETLDSKSAPAG
jgi:ATP-binding cassette subfamily F protein uup